MIFDEPDLADDIVGDKAPSHIGPRKDVFRPWHRVRKQFIRAKLWNKQISRMIGSSWSRELNLPQDNSNSSEGESRQAYPVRCLLLPGEDLIDVRSLWMDISSLQCPIRYLGFNDINGSNEIGTRVHTANNAVTSLPGIIRESYVAKDRFESISNTNSQAYNLLRRNGPYHVVNLDFCESLLPNPSGKHQAYYNAIKNLLEYQFNNRRGEWLLFVTTTVQPMNTSEDAIGTLCGPTRNNFDSHQEFAERLSLQVFEGKLSDSRDIMRISGIGVEKLAKIFGVAISKWLLFLGQSATPKWSVKMRGSFQYTIDAETSNVMLSMGFAFKPTAATLHDTSGVSQTSTPSSTSTANDELACALKIVDMVSLTPDVDGILDSDPGMKNELREAKANLLKDAGYNRTAYLEWVQSGEVDASTSKN